MRKTLDRSASYESRRQARYGVAKKASVGQRLVEQFLTQLIISGLILGLIFGAQLLGIEKINGSMGKVKSAITYSPSFDEIAKNTKEKSSGLIQRLVSRNQALDQEEIPKIIIDDQVF